MYMYMYIVYIHHHHRYQYRDTYIGVYLRGTYRCVLEVLSDIVGCKLDFSLPVDNEEKAI